MKNHRSDPEIAALLRTERARKGPSAVRRARVRERVNASILLPLAPPSPPPASSTPTLIEAARQGSPIIEAARQGSPIIEAARQGSPILNPSPLLRAGGTIAVTVAPVARLVAVAISIVAAGTAVLVTTRPQPSTTPTRSEPSAVAASPAPRAPAPPSGVRAPLPDRPLPSPTPSLDPSPSAGVPPRAVSRAQPAESPRAAPATAVERAGERRPSAGALASTAEPSAVERLSVARASTAETLAAERALLDEARGDLRSGNVAGALSSLDAHARRFPAGVLAEERDAMNVRALVAAARIEDARAAGLRFRAAHPGSLLAPTVDDALDSIP
jgi:hypothetical protein